MAGSSLSWDLVANANKYVAGMSKAEAATRKFQGEIGKTASQYGKFAAGAKAAAAGIAALGLAKFAKDSVNAYKQAEASQAKLTLAYMKFPKTANVSIESLRSYNTELQKKTKYDDDDTAAMQAHLAMFNLTGQQIKTLTPLIQDLASAQGIDLASAADLVGKAMMGNARGLKAIGINFKATGDAAKDYTTIQAALNEKVGGFAENEGKTAAGQAAILANQWGDLQETVGGALVPALTSLVGVVTPIIEKFNGLPEPLKTTTIAVAGLGAGLLILAPRILSVKALVAEFGLASRVSSTHVKGFGKAVGAMTAVLAAASIANNTLSSSTTNVDDALSLLAGNHATDQIGTDLAHIFGASTKMDDAAAALDNVDQTLADMVSKGSATAATAQYEQMRKKFLEAGGEAAIFDAHFGNYRKAIEDAKKPTDAMTGAIGGLGGAAGDASTEVQTLKEKIDGLRGTQITADEATANLEGAIDSATAAVKENGRAFTLTTAAGRANRSALSDVAKAALDGVDAWVANGASAKDVAAKTKEARDAFVATAIKMGATKTEANRLADAYGLIPKKVETEVTANNGPALAAADAVKRRWTSVVSYIAAHPAKYGAYLTAADGGYVRGYASGGHVAGAGSSRSDSIHARLSNGEFVVNARATSANRGLLEAMNSGTPIPVGSGAGGGDFSVSAPVQLRLDSGVVWQGLLRLKRSRGGIALDLA